MKLINNYMPKEYLALRINYCYQELDKLPVVKVFEHNLAGVQTKRVAVGRHRYNYESESGKKCLSILQKRTHLAKELKVYESIWDSEFNNTLPEECKARKIVRTICVDTNNQIVMNKAYFDSLKNDADTKHEKPADYYFNGIFYRSAAEREIARFYTDMGIPFKYEPEVIIKGLPKPIYPDFVIYIEELDTCKFHEHFGIKNSTSYQRITSIKYSNYANAGLIPDFDVIFTYDTDDVPFDLRFLSAKLNAAVYGTLFVK